MMDKRIKRTVFAALVVVAALVSAFSAWRRLHAPPADASVTIRYRMTVRNTSSIAVEKPKVRLSVPVAGNGYQKRARITCNYPGEMGGADDQSGYMALEWDLLAPYASKVVTVHCSLDAWRAPQKTPLADPGPYTRPQPFIESDDPRIVALAKQLAGGGKSKAVQQIFRWVRQNIADTGYVKNMRGAAYALTRGRGDCTEFACLFVALCRAGGIPARVVGGFICPRDMTLDLGEYHNWAEFYLNGRWQLADAQNNVLMENPEHYIVFAIMAPGEADAMPLVSEIRGRGLRVTFN